MKHATVLYTCIGLMGTAALAGFIDYSEAKNSGIMARLYQEESQSTGSTLITKKNIEIDDYSRGPIDEYTEVKEQPVADNSDEPKKKKKTKKFIPPPPPPAPDAPPPDVSNGEIPPPPPPKAELTPVTVPDAPVEVVKETPAIPVVEPPIIEESKEIRWESFSRAPLKKKKKNTPVVKRKQ